MLTWMARAAAATPAARSTARRRLNCLGLFGGASTSTRGSELPQVPYMHMLIGYGVLVVSPWLSLGIPASFPKARSSGIADLTTQKCTIGLNLHAARAETSSK